MTKGRFSLHSNVLPRAKAGRYLVRVDQDYQQVPHSASSQLDAQLEIVAPRWTLSPDQVVSTFPPNQSAGAFSTRLPQIVLRRRSLPWERRVKDQSEQTPYLALVVIADGEGQLKTGLPIAQCITPNVTLIGTFNDATVGDALTVTWETIRRVFPTIDDARLLAHIRQVDLTDTELALGDDDGWLAVVIANRLPQPGTRYTAYLINYEGQGNRLCPPFMPAEGNPFPPPPPAPGEPALSAQLTFPVLAHWSFTCTGSGDFQSLVQDLDVGLIGTLPGPGAFSGRKPPPPPGRPTEVLETGHVGLDHRTRDGEPDRVWYRGPLTPYPGTRDQLDSDGKLPLLHTSDQARRIGEDGRTDLTLAAGFEIGRLLALGEPSVVAELLLWRRTALAQQTVTAQLEREVALGAVGAGDVGRGFAARTGLRLLTSLGADGARRLGPVRPLVEAGEPIPGLDGDPIEILAAALGVDRDRVEATLEGGAAPAFDAVPPDTQTPNLDELAVRAESEFADLRSAVEGLAAARVGGGGQSDQEA